MKVYSLFCERCTGQARADTVPHINGGTVDIKAGKQGKRGGIAPLAVVFTDGVRVWAFDSDDARDLPGSPTLRDLAAHLSPDDVPTRTQAEVTDEVYYPQCSRHGVWCGYSRASLLAGKPRRAAPHH